jgi:2,4-dichlorophenol 6-monooxygenase
MAELSAYRVEKSTRASTAALWVIGAVILVMAIAPAFVSRSLLQDLFFLLTMIALAQCWNLLAGYGGLVSIGQQAFVGLGAYAGFGMAILLGFNPMVAIVLAGVVGAVLSIPTAFVVFRLKGAYFAIGTWVAAEVYRLIFAQWQALGGGTGTSLPSDVARSIWGLEAVAEMFDVRSSAARDIVAYWMALVLVVVVIGGMYLFLRTRNGLALSAIRDNADAAESVGVDTDRAKFAVYIFAATGAALAGALIFFQSATITPSAAFSVIEWTAFVLFIVVIGGIGTLEGPIIGAIILLLLRSWLSDYGTWYLMALGALAIAVMLVAPKGIWGWVVAKYDFSIFPTRRRLIGPDTPVPDYTKPIKEMTLPAPAGVRGADLPDEVTTMFDIETDVLIVGSGPAGVASAALLSSYGVPNVMIEKYSWLANMPRAHITNQRTMEVLRELGVEDEVYQDAVPQELMGNNVFCTSLAGEEVGRLLTWGNHPNRRADYELASPSKMIDIPQTMLEPIIFGKAMREGCLARFKTEYISHTQDEDGVVATVRDRVAEQTYRIRAKYMIGADGGRSQIVQDLGLPLDGQEGLAGSMNIEFDADLTHLVAHRPSVLYWVFQPGSAGGIGAGVLRMIRPWHKWLGMWNYDVKAGRPDYSDEEIRQILFRLIGEVVPLKVTRVSYWTVNNIVARRYSKGRVFCMGDAVHRHPPTNGLGSNTSIQDAYNLAWKLALVLKGKAGPSLLDSYNDERQPVGKQIVTRANKSIEDTLPIFETLGITGAATDEELKRRLDKRKLSTVEAEAQRKALNKQIRNKSYEFNCHGVEMGQRYASQAVVPDGTPEPEYTRDRELYYHPTTWPGARLPHVWVEHGGEKVSTLDLVGRGRFTLLTGVSGSSWVEAAARTSAETGVEVRALQVGPGCEVIDTFGDWAMQSEVSDSGCVLVRPDGYVGWRAHMLSSEPTAELTRVMKSILGTA